MKICKYFDNMITWK